MNINFVSFAPFRKPFCECCSAFQNPVAKEKRNLTSLKSESWRSFAKKQSTKFASVFISKVVSWRRDENDRGDSAHYTWGNIFNSSVKVLVFVDCFIICGCFS